MPIPEFKHTDAFQLLNNSVELARELSLELDTGENPVTEEVIYDTLHILNQYLLAVKGNTPAIVKANEVYLDLPADVNDLITAEFLSEAAIEQSRVEKAIVRGRIEQFQWFGSATMTAFGVQMYGVELISPYHKFHSSAFVPVDTISLQLAS